VEEMQTVLFQ